MKKIVGSGTDRAVVKAAMKMYAVFGGKHIRSLKGNRGLLAKMLRACHRHERASHGC